MILEFSVKNFLSFKEKVTFSMIANSNKELNDNYVEIGGNKVLKSAAIYGANASGKSNLFKILTLVVLMLRSSNSVDINAKLPLIPFKLDKGSVNKPSEFEIKFILDETRYVYGFIADKDKIYDEYLYYYPNGRETKIFDRTNINEYSYTQKDEKILREIEAKNAQNKFFLATATNWNFDKTKAAYNFLTNGIGTCNNLEILKNMAYKMYETNPDYLKDFAIDFLQKADFNIEDYQISQIDVPGEFLTAIPEFITKTLPDKPKAYQVLFKHKNSDNYLSIDEESLGTQMIFAFIPFLADSLKNKKVLIIDELDKSLHPFLVQYIVEIFNDAEINKNGSQLIFNTHDTNLLDLNILRRDQIWFTEKNSETGESDLYSLSDFSVRKQENVEKGYMLGRYGAVPFIKNDFNLWEDKRVISNDRVRKERKQKNKIIIAVEGKNKTEKLYFNNFDNGKKSYSISFAKGNYTDPLNLVKMLIEEMKKIGVDLSDGDRAYCIFDTDIEPIKNTVIKEAKKLASLSGIEIITSTPSIELWFLLHYEYTTASMDNKSLINRLKKFYPNYAKNINIFPDINKNINKAIDSAKKLEKHQLENGKIIGTVEANPSTEIYKIVEELLK